MDIVTFGELLIDMFPAEVGRKLVDVSAFRPKPGGAPANVAVAAARLGAQAAFIGQVGDDFFGQMLVDVLKREGVETRGIRFDDYARTTMAIIAKPDENHSEYIFYRNPGADTRLRLDQLDRDLVQSTRAFHYGSLSLTDEPIRSTTFEAIWLAREAGALLSFDVNYRPSLWQSARDAEHAIRELIPLSDLIKVNDDELELLTGSRAPGAAQKLLALGPSLVVLTLGAQGSYFEVAEGGEFVPAFQVETADATGCGDAFIAGLLTRLVQGKGWRNELTREKLRAHLRYANAVGALTARTLGVIPALPTAAQVKTFLEI